MTSSLLERVTSFVSANPGCTLPEIARAVRAADGAVRDVLASAAFYASARDAYPADRAQVYRLAAEAAAGLGRAARPSQCSLIASVLLDGLPHTTSEIHHRCGFSRLNSRIAELRDPRKRWGMIIVCEHIEGEHFGPDAQTYTFKGYLPGFGPSEATDTLAADVATASTPSGESVASDGPEEGQRISPVVPDLLTDGPSDDQLELDAAA